ncbi:MAG: hypothetical protein AB7E55_18155 [Pigmentiphaga sp.]
MIANNFRPSSVRQLGSLAVAALFGALPLAAQAADNAASRFQAERAACSQIANEASRQACVREAGAALQVRRSGTNGLTQPTAEQQRANALRRCERVPADQRESCVKLRTSPDVQTQGSVRGGGVLRTLTIREVGEPVPATSVPTPPAPATMPRMPSPAPAPAPMGAPAAPQPILR